MLEEGNPSLQFCIEILNGEVEREFTVAFQSLPFGGSATGRYIDCNNYACTGFITSLSTDGTHHTPIKTLFCCYCSNDSDAHVWCVPVCVIFFCGMVNNNS